MKETKSPLQYTDSLVKWACYCMSCHWDSGFSRYCAIPIARNSVKLNLNTSSCDPMTCGSPPDQKHCTPTVPHSEQVIKPSKVAATCPKNVFSTTHSHVSLVIDIAQTSIMPAFHCLPPPDVCCHVAERWGQGPLLVKGFAVIMAPLTNFTLI